MNIVVFGDQQIASLAHYYLCHDSHHNVVAFTVDKAYLNKTSFEGLPVVSFDEVTQIYPPNEYAMFLPIQNNALRKEKYLKAKEMGYRIISYCSSKATTFNFKLKENCFILENNTIQPYVEIGNNCILWSGNHIGHHSVIKDHVFITSQVVISGNCTIGEEVFLGVNATLRDGIEIVAGTTVGMAAAVTKSISKAGIYYGSPASNQVGRSLQVYPETL